MWYSTPTGVTDRFATQKLVYVLQEQGCSTPTGVTDRFALLLRESWFSVSCAQLLPESLIGSPLLVALVGTALGKCSTHTGVTDRFASLQESHLCRSLGAQLLPESLISSPERKH